MEFRVALADTMKQEIRAIFPGSYKQLLGASRIAASRDCYCRYRSNGGRWCRPRRIYHVGYPILAKVPLLSAVGLWFLFRDKA